MTQAFPIALFQHPLLLTLRAFHVLFGTDRKPFHCFTTWILTLMKEMLHLITEPLKRAPFPNEQTPRHCMPASHTGSARSPGMAGSGSPRATSTPAGISPPDLWGTGCSPPRARGIAHAEPGDLFGVLQAARKSCRRSEALTAGARWPAARSALGWREWVWLKKPKNKIFMPRRRLCNIYGIL